MGAGRAGKVDAGYPVSRHALSTCYVPDTPVRARDSALSPSPILTGAPGGSAVKNPPSMQETWVQSLGREDPLEEDMAAHSGFLAWRIPWTEESGFASPCGCRVRHNLGTKPQYILREKRPTNKVTLDGDEQYGERGFRGCWARAPWGNDSELRPQETGRAVSPSERKDVPVSGDSRGPCLVPVRRLAWLEWRKPGGEEQ